MNSTIEEPEKYDVSFSFGEIKKRTDVSITFVPQYQNNQDNFNLVINGKRHGEIWLNSTTIQNYCDWLHRGADSLLNYVKQPTTQSLIENLFDSQDGLGSIGNDVLGSIFKGDQAHAIQSILGSFDAKHLIVIHIFSDQFTIPWEWLYEIPASEAEQKPEYEEFMKHFWAWKYVIARRSLREVGTFNTKQIPDPIVPSPNGIRVGVIIDPNLNLATTHEQYWERQKNHLDVHQFSDRDAHTHNQAIELFREFISAPKLKLGFEAFDILHFFCHAVSQKEINRGGQDAFGCPEPCLRVMRHPKRRILSRHISKLDKIAARVAVLHACSGGALAPLWSSEFARLLRNRYVECVIAVESDTTSQVSHEFSEEFYRYFIDGKSIGEALYLSRRSMLNHSDKVSNLVSLFYCLYGDPNVKIAKAENN